MHKGSSPGLSEPGGGGHGPLRFWQIRGWGQIIPTRLLLAPSPGFSDFPTSLFSFDMVQVVGPSLRKNSTPFRNKLLCQLFRALRYQWISAKLKVWHTWQLKKSKSWWPFWSYQLTSTANSNHLAQFLSLKWAGLALLFSWELQNGPQDFDF